MKGKIDTIENKPFDKRANNGGYREGSGRKAPIEKIIDLTKKEAWNSYVVNLAQEMWPGLEDLASDPDPKVRLDTRKLIFAYAYGKPKESIEHSGNVGMSLLETIRKAKEDNK